MKNMNKIHCILFTLAALLMSTSTWAAGKVTFKTYSGPKITAKYSASGTTIVETTSSGATSDITSTNEVTTGALVTLTIAANDTKYLSGLTIQAVVDAGAAAPRRALEIVNTISYTTKTKYVSYEFVMPNYDVWITPTFADRTALTAINLANGGSHVFDWQPHSPDVSSVTPENSTYELTYSTDNGSNWSTVKPSITNVSESIKVKATGTGEYKGEVQATYSITARPITDATIMLSNESYVYKKDTKQAPTIDRVYLNGNLLTNGTNGYNNVQYYVGEGTAGTAYTYDDIPSQNVNTYTIQITGTGNYTGTATKTYTITQRDIATCNVTGTSFTYNGSAQYPTTSNITVSDGYGDLDTNDYDIKYWSGTAWVTTIPTTSEIGEYTFRLEGKGNYSGTKDVPYYINSNNNIYISYTNSYEYTGSQITVKDLVVKDGGSGGTVLTSGTHYDVVYSNNTNVGTAQFTVIGKNGYNFYYTKDFSITPKSVNAKTGDDDDITIELSETSFNYNTSNQKPTVTVKDGTTTLVENKDYTLSNPGAINAGTYHVSITGIGNYKDTKNSEDYTIDKLSLTGAEITLLTNKVTYDGTAQTPPIKQVKIGDVVIPSSDYDLDWANNTNAAEHTATTAPTVTVKAKTSGTINLSDSETKKFTIEQKSIANVEITLNPASFTYKNGVTQKPTTVTVKDLERNVTLELETDYSLTNNGGEAAGTYDVTVTGTGNYKGTAKKYYTISEQAGTTAITVADIDDLIYTGEAIKPTPTVTYQYDTDPSHTVTLTNDTHYTLSYENNVNVGTATVIVTLKGGYTGSTNKTFNIVARPLGAETTPEAVAAATVTSTSTTLVYNGNVQHATFTVVKKGRTLAEGVDYEVTYNGDTTSAGTQNVTVNGIGNYSGSITGTYSIAKLSLNTAVITLPATRFEYSRGAQTPTPVVSVGNFVVPSANYDVRYDNDNDTSNDPDVTNIGTKTVYVTGKLNCDGSKSTDYVIVAKQIDASMVTLTNSVMTYTGSALDPGVVVTDKGDDLQVGTEYAVELTNNTKVGTATVTVTGQGNYTGVVQKTFVIKEKDSGDFTIAAIAAVTYNGSEYKPTPAVYYGTSTTPLTINTDYTLSYINNVNAGTAIVTVTGKGGYAGSTGSQTFTINPKALVADETTLSAPDFTYNATEQKPVVTVKDGTTPLVLNKDYNLTWPADIINQGSKTITINGTGNYTGSFSKTYTINQLSLNNTSTNITLSANSLVYDASAKTPEVLLVKVGNLVVPSEAYTFSYASNTNVGTATVTVTAASSSNFKDSKNTTFSITKRTITSDMVKLNTTNFVYNGTVQKPTVQAASGYTITSNDINVVYPESKDVGVYTVVVTGKAPNNEGTVNLSYSIASNNQSDVNITMAGTDDLTYTGNPVTRNITVTKGSGTSPTHLTEGTDYTLIYNNNVNKGTATVNVIGKNGYDFVETKTYEIAARPMTAANGITITLSATSFEYNGSVQKPNVTVTYTYTKTGDTTPTVVTLVEGTDYTLNNPGAVNVSTGNKATITGIGNFTGTMDSPTYSITAKALTDAVITLYPLANPVFDGTVKEPPVQKVTVGGQVYTSGYTVSYSNNINVETATVKPTVTVSSDGTSTFSGSASTTFVIQPKPLADDMVTLNTTSYTYDGTAKEPTATVKDTSLPAALQTLTSGTDYTITYSPDHTTPGEKVATITGQGNFKGSVKKTYTIVGASDVTITLPAGTYTYNGAEHKPVVTVKKGDDPLTLNTDYTVAYSANINAGIATITVTGIGNYDFTQTKTFTIGKKPMTDAMVTLTGAPFTYNGGVQKPAVTVSDGSPSIISASDYTISNDGNINAGNYTVTVTATATGNYSGSGSQSYTINPYTLNATNTSVILDQSTFVYDRTAKKPNVLLVKVGDTMVVPTFTTAYSNNVNASNTATVTVTGSGNFTGAVDKTFVITPKSVTSDMIKFDKENFVYDGTNQKPTVTAKDGENTMTPGTDYTLTNEGGTNVGVYYAYIDGKGNYSGRASKPFYIITQNAAAFVVSDIADTEYDGTAKEPVITVTDNSTAPGTVLVKDENYTVSYLNNKDAGIATVIVTGMGSYAGTVTKNFNITPKPLAAEMISVSPGTFTFNGSLQRPDVTVTDGTIMKANDYTVINSGNVNQGTYYVTVIGQGNYKGTITNVAQTKYTITPLSIAEADVNLYELPSYVYDGTAKNPSVREVLVNNYVVPTTGYDVSYGTNIVAGPASITITGKGNFTGTKTVNFTIAQKDITSDMILLSNTEYIYTGELKKPEVTVKQGETTLTRDTDYTLSNNGGIYVGQYNVTVTGKGNYTGTASQTYNIIAQEAGSFVVTLSTESVVYTGGEQKPAVTVKKGDVTLNEGTDYTVMYIDNINVGMATVTVRGKGNYEGTVNKTFFITPKTLTGDMVTLSASSFTYNGVQQRPGVTVSDHDFPTSNDYYITNEGGVNIGSYNVIITGKSNYTGTVTKQFSITPLSLNDANIVLYEMASNIYDGKPKNPGVREVTVGTLVVPTTGYTTSVSPNINVGTVTVTVTGKDNFTGSAETTFVIMPKPLTSSMMTLTPTVFNYNGTVQKPSVTVKDGKVILTEDTDYTLTNEGGKEAGTYEVTVKGIGNYTDEATQSFIIVSSGANTFVVTLETSEYTFDGTAHKPAVTVTMEERTLSEGTDYTLTYSKNTNAGTALVTVKGVGDYTGEQVKTFTILPKALTDAMVTLDKTSFIYNEKVQKPEVTVADGTIMTADDYTVTNDGGTDEGTYQVVVTGQNNYKGVVIKSFTITREEIHGDDDPEHPDEKPITYTPTEEGSDEVKVSSLEGSETELEQITSVTIPATCTANGKTYSVVGVSANAFANVPNLTDIYLPDTEEPLEIAEDAIPTSVTVHTTLALLDDYALMPSLSENFKAGKIKATVTAKNRYWTFSSGVDVYVPDGVSVYIVHERNNAAVTIVELSDNDLTVGGQRIIKHNNGVLIGSEGNETPYDLVACGRRMSSGSTITTDDFKDYGSQNCLVPVIVPTHFDKGYYFLRNNEFYSIQEEGEDVKVPAGKAVLYLHQAASSPSYSSVIQLVNTGEITNINGVERDADEGDWYDMSGRKLNGRPTKKGVYIQNNKKIVIR